MKVIIIIVVIHYTVFHIFIVLVTHYILRIILPDYLIMKMNTIKVKKMT